MNILIFSSFIIVAILFLQYFYSTKKRIKILVLFGIPFGFFALGLSYLFNSCFGASTPINIQTINLTEQNLKIYAIAFWEDYGNGSGNYTNYDTELRPSETSEFCIDNDGGKFWLVAKNDKNEIKYLEEISKNESDFNFKINANKNVEIDKAQIAKELTIQTDKSIEFEKYLVWTNIILIGLLSFILLKNINSQ